jgi:hypothetical protein
MARTATSVLAGSARGRGNIEFAKRLIDENAELDLLKVERVRATNLRPSFGPDRPELPKHTRNIVDDEAGDLGFRGGGKKNQTRVLGSLRSEMSARLYEDLR